MMLMLIQNLKAMREPYPALGVGLCPWTDVGNRGASLHANDRYDMVQGWMAQRFGQWLDPDKRYGRAALSPISYNYCGTTPLYLQAGGREILRDMIYDFAEEQAGQGTDIMLDVWPDMPHDFQLFDSTQSASTAAHERLALAIRWSVGEVGEFAAGAMTKVAAGSFDRPNGAKPNRSAKRT